MQAEQEATEAAVDLSPLLQQVVEDYGLVGVTAFAASSNGTCAIGSAGTLAISKPNSPIDLYNSHWKSGSLAKSMTAALAALLIRDDAVQLEYNTTLKDVFGEDAQATAYESVTLKDLLGHRGGFQTEFWAQGVLGGIQLGILTGLADHDMPLMEQRRVLVRFALAVLPPVNTPGTTYYYSNMGYSIAAIMLESVTGVAFEDLMIDRLFTPLGMASAHFGCVDHLPQYAPLGHATDPIQGLIPVASASLCDCLAPKVFGCDCLAEAVIEGIPFLGIFPLFYAMLTGESVVNLQLSDWVRYYQWHLAGELGMDTSGLLSQEEFHHLHSGIDGIIEDMDGNNFSYGHGWFIYEPTQDMNNPFYNLRPLLFHDGTNRLWVSIVVMLPEVDRVYFIATNSAKTKELEPWGTPLSVIRDTMILDGYKNVSCPAIDILDSNRDPGVHGTCPNLMYGELPDEEETMKTSTLSPANATEAPVDTISSAGGQNRHLRKMMDD